MIQYMSLYISA